MSAARLGRCVRLREDDRVVVQLDNVQAIRTGKMHEFRRNYREGIDVLLVDDVQFLAGKGARDVAGTIAELLVPDRVQA